jgi:magnesium-transporting ATPase (P-type)
VAPHAPVWTLSTPQVYKTLSTSEKGLSETETALRIKQYGFNELPELARRSLLLHFTDQLTYFMALLLWVAGALAFISELFTGQAVALYQFELTSPQHKTLGHATRSILIGLLIGMLIVGKVA